MQEAVLVFPVCEHMTLLAIKRKKVGKGKWNGFGGKVEPGDRSLKERAALEVWQECRIRMREQELEKVAEIVFSWEKDSGKNHSTLWKVHVFLGKPWRGKPRSTREAKNPTWFPFAHVDYNNMMLGDRYFLPRILRGEMLWGLVKYRSNGTLAEEPLILRAYYGGEYA